MSEVLGYVCDCVFGSTYGGVARAQHLLDKHSDEHLCLQCQCWVEDVFMEEHDIACPHGISNKPMIWQTTTSSGTTFSTVQTIGSTPAPSWYSAPLNTTSTATGGSSVVNGATWDRIKSTSGL